MNQQCKVCGEPAAGFHFGAFTCEGCKSFFGRTYNNLGSITECKNNGECVINKKNRTACKACRLRKCLLVGMSKSGSRYGRRSNWFKIHCLLQEQQQQQQQHQQQQQNAANLTGVAAAAANLYRPHPYLPLFRNPTTMGSSRDARSSESDSGSSSAEDDTRSGSALSSLKIPSSPSSDRDYYLGAPIKKLPSPASDSECFARRKLNSALAQVPQPSSPASLPAISPQGLLPRWLPPLHLTDSVALRELWLKGTLPIPAMAAPDQDQPIDLSVKQTKLVVPAMKSSDSELSIDVGIDETVKTVPLDLTLERQSDVVTN